MYAKAAPHARGQVFGQVSSPALPQSLPTCYFIANEAGAKSILLCVAANQPLQCYMHVILQLLPSVLTFSVTDIGTALLGLRVAIKAAQLTKVTPTSARC